MRELIDRYTSDAQKDQATESFPLFKKAEKLGVFKADQGWLISAPTATGKSYIGIEVIKRNLPNKPDMEVFLYLVPFKALAEEILSKLKQELPKGTRINIKTGDYDRRFDPKKTDVLVATYESIDGMIQQEEPFFSSITIADEFSIISDGARGARIESLISYLAKLRSSTVLYVLSAVLENPKRVAKWLGVDLLEGTEQDRKVKLERKCIEFSEGRKGDVVRKIVRDYLPYGNFIVFCGRKDEAEKLAFELRQLVTNFMKPAEVQHAKELAAQLKIEFPYLVGLEELVASGVAYHHAGLEVDLRKKIADAFRERKTKIICATPTLSAGVNLPARFVIVRDLRHGRERVTVAEMVNMLGRAGRPGYDKLGTGCFLFPKDRANEASAKSFISRVRRSEVEKLESQIPKNMTNTLYFILSSAARNRGITRDDLITVYDTTLWGFENPLQPPFLSGKDLASKVEKVIKPSETEVHIDERNIQIGNGVIRARGGGGNYEIVLSAKKCTCSCPSYRFQGAKKDSPETYSWGGKKQCKHIKQLQYETILGNIGKRNQEARIIAIDSFKSSGLAQDPMYMLASGVDLLLSWRFLEEKEKDGKLTITKDGRQALSNYLLEMDHVRLLRDRMAKGENAKSEEDVIRWAIEDYREPKQTGSESEEEDSDKSDLSRELADAVWKHIQDGPYKQILQQKQVQRFLNAKDRLDQIFSVYLAFCSRTEKDLACVIRTARRRVHYGCRRDLLPLMILDMEATKEAPKARILRHNGIMDVVSLSKTDARTLGQLLKISEEEARITVQRAQSIVGLISDFKFTGDMAAINTLSVRTEVRVDDLLDYILPRDMVDRVRGS
jgi:superfamily II DNA/RNA helicase